MVFSNRAVSKEIGVESFGIGLERNGPIVKMVKSMIFNVDFLLLDVLNRRRGDVDLDGTVGFDDFLVLSFGSTSATWSQGDFTGDGEVTFADFLLLSSAFGEPTD